MTREEAINLINIEIGNSDTEMAHSNADMVLCLLLIDLGYGDVVAAYNQVEKWYA